MASQRLYFLEDDHIRRVVELSCETDDEAIGLVEAHTDGRPMELWQEARLVKRFEATADAAPSVHRDGGAAAGA